MAWESANTVVNDAAVELGLISAPLADVYASDDTNIVQLRALLKTAGQELVRRHSWSHLDATHVFSTTAGVSSYVLPADFARLAHQTAWNRTRRQPLAGPATPQQWQAVLSGATVVTSAQAFRLAGHRIHLSPTPTAVESISLGYVSTYWVESPEGAGAPDQDAPQESNSFLWFDGRLLSRLLKVKFYEAKGFDSSAFRADYEQALSDALGADGGAAILSLASTVASPLSEPNLPPTFGVS